MPLSNWNAVGRTPAYPRSHTLCTSPARSAVLGHGPTCLCPDVHTVVGASERCRDVSEWIALCLDNNWMQAVVAEA